MLDFTFFVIVVLCILLLLQDKNAISLRQSFFLFCIIFFGLAGYSQIKYGYEVAPMYQDIKDKDYLVSNFIIIASIVLYECVYKITYRNIKGEANNLIRRIEIRSFSSIIFLLFTILSVAYINNFSLINILLRGGDGNRKEFSQSISLLFSSYHFVFLSIMYFYSFSKNYQKIIKYILMSLFLLFCSPTAVPRLKILPLYIPFIAIAFPFLLRKRFVFSFAIAIGTLMIFPLLWITRLSVESLSGYSINGYGDFFSSMDFDTYKTLSYVVSQNIVTNGKQLLGCFFFWLPRNIWTTKPVGSGYFIAQKYDLGFGEFYNISMNYLGEGYINFGYIGIFVFVAALAYLSARFDNYFWIRAKGDFYNPISLYYFITVGYLFFLLRGDMLSGTAYYVGIIVYVFLVKRICFKEYMEPETKASNADNLNFSQIVS